MDLIDAMNIGKIDYEHGYFKGNFSSIISKELRALGAVYDRRLKAYHLSENSLPIEMKMRIAQSHSTFKEKLKRIDDKLSKILPEVFAGKFNFAPIFEKMLVHFEKNFEKSIKGITIAPSLTDEAKSTIAKDWQKNMDLWIKDFTEKEIVNLREKVQKHTFSGSRYEGLIKTIQKSYGSTKRKAKFLARQETNLLLAKFKETRYTDANVNEYIWTCVKMPKDKTPDQHTPGNVRYSHGVLDGLTFRWDNPPITTAPNEPQRRNNPGQDYNCRCFARPIVRFGDKKQ